ncbi:hypothetical protein NUW54_g9284 [Trametes sanguinea]|uniref:Uncharacterized protein n=1 Tax=Trametes sanguinea TaxID=158606 RepID=A0ACC1P9S0_9APHY|nr:hypothetical protein NUW54_g9284 [Trametes sanguinea]
MGVNDGGAPSSSPSPREFSPLASNHAQRVEAPAPAADHPGPGREVQVAEAGEGGETGAEMGEVERGMLLAALERAWLGCNSCAQLGLICTITSCLVSPSRRPVIPKRVSRTSLSEPFDDRYPAYVCTYICARATQAGGLLQRGATRAPTRLAGEGWMMCRTTSLRSAKGVGMAM